MSAPLAREERNPLRWAALLLASVALHLAIMAALLNWQPARQPAATLAHLDPPGIDILLGEEVQVSVATAPGAPEEPTPPAATENPAPVPPLEAPPVPEPDPAPEPPTEQTPPQPDPPAPSTPAPQPSKKPALQPAKPSTGPKTAPTPRPGSAAGNVTQGPLSGQPGGLASGRSTWLTPRPPYPPDALAARIQGRGKVEIATDSQGNVVSVTILEPISPALDANTREFARANWKGPPNATRIIPVIYQIR